MASDRFKYRVTIDGTDVNGITLTGARINYGATATGQPPAPTTAALQLIDADFYDDVATFPGISWRGGIPSGYVDTFQETYEGALSALKIGTSVAVRAATDSDYVDTFEANYRAGFDLTRFTGIITAIDYTPGDIRVTAVDLAEALTRSVHYPDTWPEESETDRVTRILTAAGVTGTITGTSSLTIRAGSHSRPASAWQMLTDLARSCESLVWVNREGDLVYRTASELPDTTYLAPPDATLQNTLRMSIELGDVANSITVNYGTDQSTTVTDATSIATYGLREAEYALELADTAAATAWANAKLASRKDPQWHLPRVDVHLGLADYAATIAQLLNADLDDVLELPQLLPASPESSYTSRVVGYTETLDPANWTIRYNLNPYRWR